MKIHSVGAELFHADTQPDGWTYRHKEAFRNYAKKPTS